MSKLRRGRATGRAAYLLGSATMSDARIARISRIARIWQAASWREILQFIRFEPPHAATIASVRATLGQLFFWRVALVPARRSQKNSGAVPSPCRVNLESGPRFWRVSARFDKIIPVPTPKSTFAPSPVGSPRYVGFRSSTDLSGKFHAFWGSANAPDGSPAGCADDRVFEPFKPLRSGGVQSVGKRCSGPTFSGAGGGNIRGEWSFASRCRRQDAGDRRRARIRSSWTSKDAAGLDMARRGSPGSRKNRAAKRPRSSFELPPRSTLFDYFDLWTWDGTLDRIHHALYVKCREAMGREASPTACIIDSQSVKSAEKGGAASIRAATTRGKRSRARSGISSSIR